MSAGRIRYKAELRSDSTGRHYCQSIELNISLLSAYSYKVAIDHHKMMNMNLMLDKPVMKFDVPQNIMCWSYFT